jgi:hypothetical protein
MQKHFLALILAWLAIAPAAADDAPTVMFDRKYFTDLGNIVAVEGSPTGEGASPDTTRFALICYQERRECSAILIKAYGTLVSILTATPLTYTVKVWASDRIVAEHDLACGSRETWLVDRLIKTAALFGGSCDGSEIRHWTLEDPPSWEKGKERLGELKPGG